VPRIALNGLGRIGKLALRNLIDQGAAGEVVLINDPAGSPEQHALLMEFDSAHGRWKAEIAHDAESLTLNGQRIQVTAARRIEDLPLAALGVDLVIDCTGVFKTAEKIAPYYAAGVKKVVVSAPVKDGGR
jgi:glyceraldehyde 3-phosphate dehydrogenase